MRIFPAIDLYGKKAVRLLKGDYEKMTVYSTNPLEIAERFQSSGARYIHLVDLEGAKNGDTPNIECVKSIVENTELFSEIGGGIRSMETVERYFDIGVNRVILGTSAVEDEEFLKSAVKKYGNGIAVGVDIKDGFVATRGWLRKSQFTAFEFCEKMVSLGIDTLICTDISKDGAMQGTNFELYKELKNRYNVNITASGGVSSIEDVKKLRELDLYGAIIGKAYYTNAIDLKEAVEVAK